MVLWFNVGFVFFVVITIVLITWYTALNKEQLDCDAYPSYWCYTDWRCDDPAETSNLQNTLKDLYNCSDLGGNVGNPCFPAAVGDPLPACIPGSGCSCVWNTCTSGTCDCYNPASGVQTTECSAGGAGNVYQGTVACQALDSCSDGGDNGDAS